MSDQPASGQLLHLVFGGELTSPERVEFKDLTNLDVVGIYPDYKSAHSAWRGHTPIGGCLRKIMRLVRT